MLGKCVRLLLDCKPYNYQLKTNETKPCIMSTAMGVNINQEKTRQIKLRSLKCEVSHNEDDCVALRRFE